MSSLGGKNSLGRQSGARSSRASSTIFHQLRQLDRQIASVEKEMLWRQRIFLNCKKLTERFIRLDAKRKQLRAKRKAHNFRDAESGTPPRVNGRDC